MDSIQIEEGMTKLFFVFFKILEKIEINTTLRVSIWLEEDSYLMPCEFSEVLVEDNFYAIKTNVLDPKGMISDDHLERKFLFGHPGKIIGYGILKEIALK